MNIWTNFKSILRIRGEEKWLALVSVAIFSLLNFLTVSRYYGDFSRLSDHYHTLFVGKFRVSGFDPLTYEVISNWTPAYNVYRHPLLAFFMYPANQVNQCLMELTGMNFATIITAVILVVCSVYSCLFLYRILREVIEIRRMEAYSLCAMYFGFAFIMLSTMVPDHFVMSMTMLLLTLYVTGLVMKKGRGLSLAETLLLFILTAGISLNNGLKVFLAGFVSRGRSFFNWKYLLAAVAIPSALMWGFARFEYKTWVWPKEMARKEAKLAKKKATEEAKLKADTAKIVAVASSAVKPDTLNSAKAPEKPAQKKVVKFVKKQPKSLGKGEFMRWTDISTPRWDTAVENLFGEAIQLHPNRLLADVYRGRPAIVRYANPSQGISVLSALNYAVEALIVILFAIGIWAGWRSRFLWLTMLFFLTDMMLHMGLGFGIDEIYIMSPHYLFVIPIAMAYIFRMKPRLCLPLSCLIAVLAVWCWAWNGHLIVGYML